ncbi:MAG: DUF86 domain-containing protein [Synergistaceae bacterium]|nr:DUF86 domain-containing protein [Synergistaceae bacterium]
MNLTDKDKNIIARMIKYCDDICTLMEQYNADFHRYTSEIAFQYACGMCLIQIGELAGRISDKTADEHPEIPWRAIRGMRNIHAHDYGSVDHAIVWETLKKDIPDLRHKLSEIVSV